MPTFGAGWDQSLILSRAHAKPAGQVAASARPQSSNSQMHYGLGATCSRWLRTGQKSFVTGVVLEFEWSPDLPTFTAQWRLALGGGCQTPKGGCQTPGMPDRDARHPTEVPLTQHTAGRPEDSRGR
jgi:hypothetical protein